MSLNIITVGGTFATLSRLVFWFFLPTLFSSVAAKDIVLLADGDMSAWQYQTFNNITPTNYETGYDEELGQAVLFADSERGASGYVYETEIDLQGSPWLHFQWRVDLAAAGFDTRKKEGDDFAFRIYFVHGGSFPASESLSLVRTHGNAGESWTSPYSIWLHELRMYSFAGGDSPIGEWRSESINLATLWRRVYGEDPPTINYIGLMTDGDSSGSIMRARYGNIILSDSEKSPFN